MVQTLIHSNHHGGTLGLLTPLRYTGTVFNSFMTEVQYIDLVCISMKFSYDTDLRHERVKYFLLKLAIILDFEKVSKFI